MLVLIAHIVSKCNQQLTICEKKMQIETFQSPFQIVNNFTRRKLTKEVLNNTH